MLKPMHAVLLSLVYGLGGCASAPTGPTLEGAEWRIEDIAGKGVIDRSHAALQFLDGGQLAGSSGCNRLLGVYASEGHDRLTIDTAGTTRMACPAALMRQERQLLDLLPKITRYTVDASGALVLSTLDGKSIVARR